MNERVNKNGVKDCEGTKCKNEWEGSVKVRISREEV